MPNQLQLDTQLQVSILYSVNLLQNRLTLTQPQQPAPTAPMAPTSVVQTPTTLPSQQNHAPNSPNLLNHVGTTPPSYGTQSYALIVNKPITDYMAHHHKYSHSLPRSYIISIGLDYQEQQKQPT